MKMKIKLWIDRRTFFTRVWNGNPLIPRCSIILSDLGPYDHVKKILGGYHGCRKGKILAVDVEINVSKAVK